MSEMYEPGWGNPSLRSIVEPEVPESISLMPSTPGWWLVLLLVVALIIRAALRRRREYLRDRYRREALAQLADIKSRLGDGSAEAVRELAPLLRATAIEAAGRQQVSGLEDDAYADALKGMSPDGEALPVAELQRLAYAPLNDLKDADTASMVAAMERWIQQHRRAHA